MHRFFPTLLFLLSLVASAQGDVDTYLAANGSDPETTRGASRLLHYQPEDFPVEVYVPAPPPARSSAPPAQMRRTVIRAFRAWQEAAPDLVSFEFVNAPGEGMLRVTWPDLPPNLAGSYRYAFEVLPTGVYRYRATRVLLDPATDPDDLYRYALLQVGHVLGLFGRSPFEGDALSAVPSGEVTERDVATLRALYALPSGTVLR